MWYLDVSFLKTDFFNTFFSLSHTFGPIHSVLKHAPVLSQKSEKMHLLRTFCSSTAKTSTANKDSANKDSASFRWEKNWQKSMISFLAISLTCTDWAITGRIGRIQLNSTLGRKVKTRALKGIFLLSKWINNTWKSNSERYHILFV